MKNLITLFCFFSFITNFYTLNAQDVANISDNIPQNFKKRSPIYDYTEKQLNSVDTIPDFASQANKLKITGIIYESDGVTPAKNVLLFIHQADENGNFELKRENKKRYVHHRGWIKTDADGRYTFYTFVPGSYIYGNELKQILPIIKEPGKPEQKIETFVFDDDPLLKDACREKIVETNPSRILKLDKKEGLFVAHRDITLGKENTPEY
jgi:protocatechuate 3,4-dioxygenase beta subunit